MTSGSKLLLRLFSCLSDTISEYSWRSSADSAHKMKRVATSAIAETLKDGSSQEPERNSVIDHALLYNSPLSRQIISDQAAVILLPACDEAPKSVLIHSVIQFEYEFDHSASYIGIHV